MAVFRNRYMHASTRVRGPYCVYCGLPTGSRDHWPPRSVVTAHGFLLPACLECNSLAGNECPTDFHARVAYVKAQLSRKYRKALTTPDWDEDELDELGAGLRNEVVREMELKTIVRERLAWSAVAYLTRIDVRGVFRFVTDELDELI